MKYPNLEKEENLPNFISLN